MIPADIKEMAKHDELVAEILATGGPFFYQDFKRIRNGKIAAVANSMSRKAGFAGVLFLTLVLIYAGLLITGFILQEGHDGWFEPTLQVISLVLYGFIAWTAMRKRASMRTLVARIDAGEFSTD